MRKRLILLEPFRRETSAHVHYVRMLFLSNGWEVQKISPDQKTYHENGILLLPDSSGLNGCVSYCMDEDAWMPPNIPAQDQAVEFFRLNVLKYYINKGIPILGLGYSSLLTFAEVLGGKLIFGQDGMSRGAQKYKIVDDDGVFYSTVPGKICAGFDQYAPFEYGEELVVTAEKLLSHHGGNKTTVTVTVPKPDPPKNTKLVL